MKSFKQFMNEPIAVFCNSGGQEHQYKHGISKDNAVYCNSGGPLEQKESIEENLNPRNNPVVHETDSQILYDPEKDNKGLGDERYNPKNIIQQDREETDYTEPHFNAEQAKNIQTLSDDTDDDDTRYHDIIPKYTWRSSGLNRQLFKHHARGEYPDREIFANDDDEHPINIDDFDDLIDSHRLPHEMTVYTGMHFHPNQHRGRIYTHPAYMSTSITPHVSKEFGESFEMYNPDGTSRKIKNILRLHLPKNHPYLLSDKASAYPGQGEIILPRHTKFQLGQKPTHIIRGNFLNHFGNGRRATHNEFHIYTGRILK